MKFGQKLESNICSEWRAFYVDYKALKKRLEPKIEVTTTPSMLKMVNPNPKKKKVKSLSVNLLHGDELEGEEPFLVVVRREAAKVQQFYEMECIKLSQRFMVLSDDIEKISSKDPKSPRIKKPRDESVEGLEESEVEVVTKDSIQRAIREVYREMMLLQNFTHLNHTAIEKIVKKYRKLSRDTKTDAFLQEIRKLPFVKAPELMKEINDVEELYRINYARGNLTTARVQLLAKQRIDYDWSMFHSGLHFGVVFVLLIWVLWDCIVDRKLRPVAAPEATVWNDESFVIYRGLAALVLLSWCWGINIYVWDKARVNFMYILELDARTTKSYPEVFQFSCNITILYLCSFLLYNKIERGDFPRWIPNVYFPVVTLAVFAVMFVLPFSSRKFLLWTMAKVCASPFTPVNFFASFVGDIMTSLVKPFVDLAFGVCFVFSGQWTKADEIVSASHCLNSDGFRFVLTPIIIASPLFFRLMQCLRRYRDTNKRWPHWGNAGKYSVAQSVVLFGAFHPSFKSNPGQGFDVFQSLWVISLAISTLYTYSWDVFMDWGLGERQYSGLRGKLMYSQKWVYYAAIVADLFLRFTWTLTLLPNNVIPFIKAAPTLFDFAIALLEVLRRTMWAFFRIEWEHLTNTEQYRRNDFIPLHFNVAKKEAPKFGGWKVALEIFFISGVVIAIAVAAAVTHITSS